MSQTVLLTGINGYLGSYVAKILVDKGYKVIGLYHPHFRSTKIVHKNISYVAGDLVDFSTVAPKLLASAKKIDAILHVAALLGEKDYDKNYAVNAQGTQNLINFAKENNIPKFSFVSTVCTIKEVKGPYGKTKKIAEKMVMDSKLDYTIFIPALILGPQSLGLNRILKNMYRFPFIVPLVGSAKETQHPIFVEDFARLIVESISNKKASKKTYQVAGDTVISFKNLIKQILKIHKKRRIFIHVPIWLVSCVAKIMETVLHRPPFTSEHVKGLTQSSHLDTKQTWSDFKTKPTPLDVALKKTLKKIDHNYSSNLKAREEKVVNYD